ncbi:MAG: hypothetical protein K2Y01_01330 [Rhabdochlamydiaceae bacterium]|nr:hypothetical protein [Rhabdochlamydiaceae bacterium]
MKLNLSTDSNPIPSLFISSKDPLCAKGRLLQRKALSTLRSYCLSKPADGLLQRIWKVLPYISTMIYKAVACVFPFVSYYWKGYFLALDLLIKRSPFTEDEKKLLSQFFIALNKNPEQLFVLRAFANSEQYRMLVFLQGIFLRGDAAALKEKLDNILLGKISPLTVEELGLIQFSPMRAGFLRELQEQKIEGVDSPLVFWEKMEEIRQHPVIETFRQRTLALFSEGCLGFITSYEDEKRIKSNLRKDAMRSMNFMTIWYYLLVSNFSHIGFSFVKDGRIYISDVTGYHKHLVRPSSVDILHPTHYLYRFKIKPLLSSQVSSEHASFLQKFFLAELTKKVAVEQDTRLGGIVEALQTAFLGSKTPFWDPKTGIGFQKREFCTAMQAKSLTQVFLQTQQKLQELGYTPQDLRLPFLPHEHIGRMMVPHLIGRLYQQGVIEPVEDPLLKACIEPGFLEAELPFAKSRPVR